VETSFVAGAQLAAEPPSPNLDNPDGAGNVWMRKMVARRVYYEGRVQGVGFRYTVRGIANGYEVQGWVRNLLDGRVELLAQGELGEVKEFLGAIRDSVLKSHIRKVIEHAIPPAKEVKGFEISF
jgi:acylphosphatase